MRRTNIFRISLVTRRSSVVKSKFSLNENELKLTKLSYPRFMLSKMKTFEKAVGIVNGTTKAEYTFTKMYNDTYLLAESFKKMDVEPGMVVALISPNDEQYFSCIMAVGLNGASATTVNPLYTVEEMVYQLETTRVEMIIAHPSCLEKAIAVSNILNVVIISMGETPLVGELPVFSSLQRLRDAEDIANIDRKSFVANRPDFDTDSTLLIPFSSGTTGQPKGVTLSHKNIIFNTLQAILFEGDSLKSHEGRQVANLCPLPYFHIYGIMCANISLYCGAKHVFMSSFELEKFLELVQKYRVEKAFVVPPIILALAKHPAVDKFDLSSLKCLMSGAAPLGAELQSLCEDRLEVMIKQGWGMTELSPLATGAPDGLIFGSPLDRQSVQAGAAGLLVADTEGKVVDPTTGSDLLSSENGEICIRGPQIMRGYFENEEATAATIDKDGWLHTGDVGHFDERGFLFITDRCKELIKYKGFQVAPAELESIIASMSGVKDVVVIPVDDEQAGEIPRAYVVRQDDEAGNLLTEAEVEEYVQAKVAPHKRLRGGVRFTATVPKSPSGKILRRVQKEIDRKLG